MVNFGKRETNIMKGVAICLMMTHHLFYSADFLVGCRFIFPGSETVLIAFAKMCKACVAVFVMLSGFGLYRSFEKYGEDITFFDTVKFVFSHIKKLLSGYWWCLAPFFVFGIVTGARSFSYVY